MNLDNSILSKIVKYIILATFLLAVIFFVVVMVVPYLAYSEDICYSYRNVVKHYKIITMCFIIVGLIGLLLKQQKRLSISILILGVINGLVASLYYFSSACIGIGV